MMPNISYFLIKAAALVVERMMFLQAILLCLKEEDTPDLEVTCQ